MKTTKNFDDIAFLQQRNRQLAWELESIMSGRRDSAQLERALQVCDKSARGVFKRIDENRELLELLQQEAPDLLERCGWIEGWIAGQDIFLCDLVQALGIENPFKDMDFMYPRPWPGKSWRAQ
jgi:hypothetical protein